MRARRGSLLLEVIVATLITSLVCGVAVRIIRQLVWNGSTNATRLQSLEDAFLAERKLRGLLRLASTGSFGGDAMQAHLRSRCVAASGLYEPCMVDLIIENVTDVDAQQLVIRTSVDTVYVSVGHADGFRFLQARGGDGIWVNSWKELGRAPYALQLLRRKDTLTFRIGSPP
jgi:hypothetical protein